MEHFEIEIQDERIYRICNSILRKDKINRVKQICERYGEEETDIRKYDVYSLETGSGSIILKQSDDREVFNYEKYLNNKDFKVPKYFGNYRDGHTVWIVLEKIEGNDLRDMTDQLAISAANSISAIQNHYWGCKDRERYDAYWKRINKRYQFIKKEPVIGEAYNLFLQHQQSCPRTMSNGDFQEFNAVLRDDEVYIIDWGFGGIMPYSLDIARFIAHATEDRATFPFYMKDAQKALFVKRVYDNLEQKPTYEQYLFDIKLAVLNEYVEFIEADEDENGWYFQHAKELAKEILDLRKH